MWDPCGNRPVRGPLGGASLPCLQAGRGPGALGRRPGPETRARSKGMVQHGRLWRVGGGVGVVIGLAITTITPAAADNGIDTSALRNAVTVAGILGHEQALQAIADANGGTRAAGSPGYAASGDYVEAQLEDAGYQVTRQPFTYEQFILGSSAMQQTSPLPTTYVENVDFAAMDYSGSGTATGVVRVVDVNLAGDRASTSGCEATDFSGFPSGAIALMQRGSCTFRQKV